MTLEHRDPDCAGEWTVEDWGRRQYARCQDCGALYYPSDEVWVAMRRESALRAALAELSGGA
jgi:uncharacterized OB-fold protein